MNSHFIQNAAYFGRVSDFTLAARAHATPAISVGRFQLQPLAALPFEMDIFFGPMHTATLEERLSRNSEMSAFFFALLCQFVQVDLGVVDVFRTDHFIPGNVALVVR